MNPQPEEGKASVKSKQTIMKKYKVNIDMNFSQDIKVSANNEADAKKKAWEIFTKKKPSKKNFTIQADIQTV